jgi:hypothetical protein
VISHVLAGTRTEIKKSRGIVDEENVAGIRYKLAVKTGKKILCAPPASPSVGDQTSHWILLDSSRWMLLDSREAQRQQSGEGRRTCSGGAGPPGSSTRQAVRTRRGVRVARTLFFS